MYVYLFSCYLLMFNIFQKTTLYSYIDDSYVSLLFINYGHFYCCSYH